MRISDLSSDVCSSDLKIKRGLRTVALFFAICILWSVWTSESLAQWSSIWNFFWQGIPSSGSAVPTLFLPVRSEERRVGPAGGRPCRSRGPQYHYTQNPTIQIQQPFHKYYIILI